MSLESALRELSGGPRSYYANCSLSERLYEARRTEQADTRVLAFKGTWTDFELSHDLRKAPTICKVLVHEGKIDGKDGNDLRGQLRYYEAWSREQRHKSIAELLTGRESHLAKQKRRIELLKMRQPLEVGLDDSNLDYDFVDEGFIEPAVIEVQVWVSSAIFNDLHTTDLRFEQIDLNLEVIPDNQEAFANVAVVGYRLLWKAELAPSVRIEAFHFHIKEHPTELPNETSIHADHSSVHGRPGNPFEKEILVNLIDTKKSLTWGLFILMGILLAIFLKK